MDSKNEIITVTTSAAEDTAPHQDGTHGADESGFAKPDRNVAAAVWAIVCGVTLPCIPVIVISAVLLYFIFHYQIVPRAGWPELELPTVTGHEHRNFTQLIHDVRHQGGNAAYYVHYNPSTITTIASWTGRVIPYLSSSIMALVAFFAARRIVTNSKRGDGSHLPTPEQLTLLIGLLGGNSFSPLKETLVHRWARKQRLIDPLPLAFHALLLVVSFGLLIPIVDTWFGIATTPAIITQLYNDTSSHRSYGRGLSETLCADGPGNFEGLGGLEWLSCNLDYNDQDPYGIYPSLVNSDEATRLIQGLSTQNTVLNYTSANGTTYYYLADLAMNAQLDFKARTFAVSTQCAPITKHCLPGQSWPYLQDFNFTCSQNFQANFSFNGAAQTIDASGLDGGTDLSSTVPLIGMAFSPDSDLSRRVGAYYPNLTGAALGFLDQGVIPADSPVLGSNWSYQYLLPQNPLHFGVWASGFPTYDQVLVESGEVDNPLLNDTEIFLQSGFTYWMLGCSATVYDITYTWVNGSVHTFNASASSAEMGGLVSAPFAFELGQAAVALTSMANLASIQNTSVGLANVFAEGWSKTAAALTISVMDPAENIIEQVRNSTVGVARVPMVPLYLLLGLKGLYVVAVVVLAIGAYCFTHPAETETVKTQLSARGLAAAHFDSPDLVQQNVVKEVGVRLQAARGYKAADDATAEDDDPKQRQVLKRANTAPAAVGDLPEKKVGMVAKADGAWTFAVVADGVWHGVKPIAVSLLDLEAKDGNLGVAGDVINAW